MKPSYGLELRITRSDGDVIIHWVEYTEDELEYEFDLLVALAKKAIRQEAN